MARTFAATDEWQGSIGNCNFSGAGGVTIASIINSTDTGAYRRIAPMLYTSGGAQQLGLNRDNANRLWGHFVGGSDVTSTVTIGSSDGWALVAVTKASGTVSPIFYKIILASGAVTSNTPAGTSADHTAPGAGSTVRFGTGDSFVGDWCIGALWTRVLSQAELETLINGLQYWYASSPTGLWLADQSATTQAIPDLTGGGAQQSSLTGTSVSTVSAPFSYGHVAPEGGFVPTWVPESDSIYKLRVVHGTGRW